MAEMLVFWNTAFGNKIDISICKSHFKCLGFVTWYVTWFWDIYPKKKRKQIQQGLGELKLHFILNDPRNSGLSKKTECAHWELFGALGAGECSIEKFAIETPAQLFYVCP